MESKGELNMYFLNNDNCVPDQPPALPGSAEESN